MKKSNPKKNKEIYLNQKINKLKSLTRKEETEQGEKTIRQLRENL